MSDILAAQDLQEGAFYEVTRKWFSSQACFADKPVDMLAKREKSGELYLAMGDTTLTVPAVFAEHRVVGPVEKPWNWDSPVHERT